MKVFLMVSVFAQQGIPLLVQATKICFRDWTQVDMPSGEEGMSTCVKSLKHI